MGQDISVFDKLRVFQLVNREWRSLLTVSERDFLTYLIDNTVSYGRLDLYATVDQMLTGTDWNLPPVGTSRRSLFRLLSALKQKGVLIVETLKRGVNRYTLNLGWTKDMQAPKNKRERAGGLARPKSSANLALEQETQCQIGTPKSNSTPSGKSDSHAAEPRSSSVSEVVEAIKAKSREKLRESTNLPDVWRSAWLEGGFAESAPVLSKKDEGKLAHVVKRWPKGIEVVRHAVANWTEIMGREFAWMTDSPPPSRPAPGFICYFSENFAEDFASIADRDSYWASPVEEREYLRLKKSGLTHDQAMLEVGKKRARADERGDAAAKRKQLRDEEGALVQARVQLDRERKELARQRAAAKPREPEPAPTINHGDNPWENGGGEMADFSSLPKWEDGE